ncbi:hypothetical protein ACFL0M_14500 [Thermodesulfobacteriota bacterium]
MDLINPDDLPSSQIDNGNIVAACNTGLIRGEDVLPLERIIATGSPINRSKQILFKPNGIAKEDLAVDYYVLEKARRKKVKGKRLLKSDR